MTISFSNQLVAEMYQPFWLGCVSPVVSARAVAGICKVGAQCSTTSPDTLADVASHHGSAGRERAAGRPTAGSRGDAASRTVPRKLRAFGTQGCDHRGA